MFLFQIKSHLGPNNFLAVASENIVTVYQLKDIKLEIYHKITKHKAKITALSWNIPTVDFYKSNSFDVFFSSWRRRWQLLYL